MKRLLTRLRDWWCCKAEIDFWKCRAEENAQQCFNLRKENQRFAELAARQYAILGAGKLQAQGFTAKPCASGALVKTPFGVISQRCSPLPNQKASDADKYLML